MPRDTKELDERPVFLIGQTPDGPALMIGIPDACREMLKDGNSHAFNLTKAGLPLKVLIYGAKDHDAAIAVLEGYAKENNLPFFDERRKNFGL